MNHTPTPFPSLTRAVKKDFCNLEIGNDDELLTHVVHCVNTHAALVEALRFIADQHDHGKAGNWAVEIAKNALAQAEKGTPS